MDGDNIVGFHIGGSLLLLILQGKFQDMLALWCKFIQRSLKPFDNCRISQKILLYNRNLLLDFTRAHLGVIQGLLCNLLVATGYGTKYRFLHCTKQMRKR